MRSILLVATGLSTLASGCAHTNGNQYAYAPPLAPPVYPQPQSPSPPVVYPAPAAGAASAPVMPAGAVPAAMMPAPPAVSTNGDPCCPPLAGTGGVPVVYESADQTPPCPPAP
jgi:hypothetical protein